MLAQRAIPVNERDIHILKSIIQQSYDQRDEGFGNAGEMRNLADSIERRWAVRIIRDKLKINAPMSVDDIPEKYRIGLLENPEQFQESVQELEELVGLEKVKTYLRQQTSRLQLEALKRELRPGRMIALPIQNLVFCGNPGTGKTTVARLIGKIYVSLGLLKKGHCVEVSRSDLVAPYVGQTAIKTMEKIKSALDGILFIDEAYALARGDSQDFGQEAIDTLVKAMDDYKGRLVVIVAGYPAEMRNFLHHNPGLTSRFSQPITFPDYSMDELIEIIQRLAKQDDYQLSPEVLVEVRHWLELTRLKDSIHFGNARTAIDLMEQMKGRLAERIIQSIPAGARIDLDKLDLSRFVPQDVPPPGFSVIINSNTGVSSENRVDNFVNPLPWIVPDDGDIQSGVK
jgi:SpoVK/Ycf46/Vps4 family AAA+-type ATPase